MNTLNISPLPFACDNYLWLIDDGRHAVLVDPGEAAPALAALEKARLVPVAVLLTHHHADHVGGVPALLARYAALPVYGPRREGIAGVNHPLDDGDTFRIEAFGGGAETGLAFQVIDVCGHTRGHIAYFCAHFGPPPGHGVLFCGDALFSAGCGRLFEGSPADLDRALARLDRLDDETRLYCAHEYTLANLAFARAAEPENTARDRYAAHCEALRQQGLPTLPSTLGLERAINPFLRTDAESVIATVTAHCGTRPDSRLACLAALRGWKDVF